MSKKTTSQLLTELGNAKELNYILKANTENFASASAQGYLQELVEAQEAGKADLAQRAGISTVYLYQLLSGERTPSRNKVLCLSLAMGLDVACTQELLRKFGFAALYSRDRRDAIILYGLMHGQTVEDVDKALFAEGEKALN